jgi:hypothetical protein
MYLRKRPSHHRPQPQTEGMRLKALYEARLADESKNRMFMICKTRR